MADFLCPKCLRPRRRGEHMSFQGFISYHWKTAHVTTCAYSSFSYMMCLQTSFLLLFVLFRCLRIFATPECGSSNAFSICGKGTSNSVDWLFRTSKRRLETRASRNAYRKSPNAILGAGKSCAQKSQRRMAQKRARGGTCRVSSCLRQKRVICLTFMTLTRGRHLCRPCFLECYCNQRCLPYSFLSHLDLNFSVPNIR